MVEKRGVICPDLGKLSAGRGYDLQVKTNFSVIPEYWDSKKQTIKNLTYGSDAEEQKLQKEHEKLKDEKGIALCIQQFNMLTMENNQENPIAKMLLQMLSTGTEMESNQRKIRQEEGIKLAQLKKVYQGRKKGAKTSSTTLINKYKDITELLNKSELSLRRIADVTRHSVNTVRRIKQLK